MQGLAARIAPSTCDKEVELWLARIYAPVAGTLRLSGASFYPGQSTTDYRLPTTDY
jgi:hypothetical protein